jgi:hypothetical protein
MAACVSVSNPPVAAAASASRGRGAVMIGIAAAAGNNKASLTDYRLGSP